MTGRLPDKGTNRRIISDWFIKHRSLIMPHVLEVGSARPKDAWWADLRSQLGMQDEEWTGVDMQDSECTDVRCDLTQGIGGGMEWGKYGSCVCAETLEHVDYPADFLEVVFMLLRPGAWIVITTPFAFPVHGFPNDYWRFTPEGMKLLLKDAGFEDAWAKELELLRFHYADHDIKDLVTTRDLPLWIGAIARKPE
ncbi:MAG: hypothetical protein ACYSWO_29200 [Planctomycetota bacterium]|jgi:hypothetical protein